MLLNDRVRVEGVLNELLAYKMECCPHPSVTWDTFIPIKDQFPAKDMLHSTGGHSQKSGTLSHSLMGLETVPIQAH